MASELATAPDSAASDSAQSVNPDRYEPAAIPVVAGDTDVGIKVGAVGQVARFRPGLTPYAWRAQALAMISILDTSGGWIYPYRELTGFLDVPQIDGAFRLKASASYFRTTNLGYYGIGNALSPSKPSGDSSAERHFHQYDGTSIFAQGSLLYALTPALSVYAGGKVGFSQVKPYAGSLLAQHEETGAGPGTELLGVGSTTHVLTSTGVIFDTRDHETVTTRGHWHELGVRVDPGLFTGKPYLGSTLILRHYTAIDAEKLSFGVRLLADVLSPNAPLTELGQFGVLDPHPGPAGSQAIRGIPQGRLQGRTKVIGNVEVRSLLLPFMLFGQQAVLGAAVFFDTGRVWSQAFHGVPELDGTGLGLHWGAGGGPRLRYGDSLVLRCDVAYAPLGAQLGSVPAVYVDVVNVL